MVFHLLPVTGFSWGDTAIFLWCLWANTADSKSENLSHVSLVTAYSIVIFHLKQLWKVIPHNNGTVLLRTWAIRKAFTQWSMDLIPWRSHRAQRLINSTRYGGFDPPFWSCQLVFLQFAENGDVPSCQCTRWVLRTNNDKPWRWSYSRHGSQQKQADLNKTRDKVGGL